MQKKKTFAKLATVNKQTNVAPIKNINNKSNNKHDKECNNNFIDAIFFPSFLDKGVKNSWKRSLLSNVVFYKIKSRLLHEFSEDLLSSTVKRYKDLFFIGTKRKRLLEFTRSYG